LAGRIVKEHKGDQKNTSLEVLHHVVAVEELRMDKFFEPTNSWLNFAATKADTLGKRFVSQKNTLKISNKQRRR
jgi:hypothetical protein